MQGAIGEANRQPRLNDDTRGGGISLAASIDLGTLGAGTAGLLGFTEFPQLLATPDRR